MARAPALPHLLSLVVCAATAGCSVVHGPQWAEVKPVRIDPSDSQATTADGYYADASAAILSRDYGRALDLLQLARRQPGRERDARILNAFGVVYDKLGRFDLSASYYAQALALDPNSPVVKSNLAYSQQLQQHWRQQGDSYDASPTQLAARAAPAVAGRSLVLNTDSTPPPRTSAPVEVEPAPPARSTAETTAGESRSIRASWPGPATAIPAVTLQPTPAVLRMTPPDLSQAQPPPYVVAFLHESANLLPAAGSTQSLLSKKPAPRVPALLLLDASGQAGRVRSLRMRLSRLGWSAGSSAPRLSQVAPRSLILFPNSRLHTAKGLARTLPGTAELRPCGHACKGIQLIFGADVRGWRLPPNAFKQASGEG